MVSPCILSNHMCTGLSGEQQVWGVGTPFSRGVCLHQVGFVVALLAEFTVPAEGLFGAWDGHSLSVFGASASFLIACAAVRGPLMSFVTGAHANSLKRAYHVMSVSLQAATRGTCAFVAGRPVGRLHNL